MAEAKRKRGIRPGRASATVQNPVTGETLHVARGIRQRGFRSIVTRKSFPQAARIGTQDSGEPAERSSLQRAKNRAGKANCISQRDQTWIPRARGCDYDRSRRGEFGPIARRRAEERPLSSARSDSSCSFVRFFTRVQWPKSCSA